MKKLHKGKYDKTKLEPSEGQRVPLCSNNVSLRCPSLSSSITFSKETLAGLESLGAVLKTIHQRLLSEGYQIQDGTIFKVEK